MIIPLEMSYNIGIVELTSWRLYIIILSIFSLTASISISALPETPKYLLTKGLKDEALKVISQIFSLNNNKPASDFLVNWVFSSIIILNKNQIPRTT